MRTSHSVTIDLKVDSVDALYNAAFERALKDGETVTDALQTLGSPEEPDVSACLIMLLDPGSLPGCSIDGSEVANHLIAEN